MRRKFKKCKLSECENPVLLKNRLYCCVECSKKGYISTNIKKYGVSNPLKSLLIRKKAETTTLSRYGVKNIQQRHISESIQEKCNDAKWLINEHHTNKKSITKIAEELGINQTTLCRYFYKHNVEIRFFRTSEFEREVHEYIKSIYDGEIILNSRAILGDTEIDIYIPEFRLGIECNGIYWHTELSGNRDSNYHLRKLTKCENKNIDLVNIIDIEWQKKNEIIKSMIRSRLNKSEIIYGRLTDIREVSSVDEREFLEENHIQGYISSSVAYGLYFNGNLVSLMTFGKSRFEKNTIELLRFCNKMGVTVVGGASKLFKKYIVDFDPISIVSYSHRGRFSGNLYKLLGFTFSHSSKPSYYYTNDYREIHNRIKYQKHRLPKLLENFNTDLTEWENMQNNGYDRIWDCGNNVWVFRRNK